MVHASSVSLVSDGAPMSLQSAYAAFIGFEGGVGGKLTLEMYNVYAGLKGSGYVIFRTGSWDHDRGEIVEAPPKSEQETTSSPNLITRFFTEIWRRLSQPTYTIPTSNLAFGPLLKPGLFRSYTDIYRLLKLIPARIGISPRTARRAWKVSWIAVGSEQYSPTIQSAPRKTFPDLISGKVCTSF